jgi:hypothetical protein
MRSWLLLGLWCASCAGVVPGRDAGFTVEDAAVAFDAGQSFDAGAGEDAGQPLDAGVVVDAGLPLDAGASRDAGSSQDGGSSHDAGFRDWASFPAIVELDTTGDVFIVGDAHADPLRLEGVLVGAGLIASAPATPAQVQWSGGTATVVFTGDLIDKWTDSLGALTLVRTLQSQAHAAGGHVIVLLGNHEAEFLADPTGSKTAEFAGELTASGLAPADVAAGRNALGQELRNRPFAARVNDFFISHAGNTGGRSLAQLDAALRLGLDTQGFASPILMDPDSLLEARLSPPWFEAAGIVPATLVGALGSGIAHIVEGHQPGSYTFKDGTSRPSGKL